MSIEDITEKIKGFTQIRSPRLRTLPDDLFLGLVIILTAFGSFGLGRLSRIEGARTPIRIENAPKITEETFTQKATVVDAISPTLVGNDSGQLVGSKNGKKYYYV